ncbi:MAG: peptidylprolyl isomerase [Gemmatimonadales bacterium]|nr:peptidylprolyl isomerase [Gemmatimonadales bacterium]
MRHRAAFALAGGLISLVAIAPVATAALAPQQDSTLVPPVSAPTDNGWPTFPPAGDTPTVGTPSGDTTASPDAPAAGQPSAPAAAVARPQTGRDTTFVVDKVLAVVGNRPVLASQVDEELFSRQSQGTKLPESPDQVRALRREIVSSIIDEELLVQQAQRDTMIKVTDQEIADGVEEQVRKVRQNFTSELDYTAELRKAGFQTPEEYRRWLTDQQRRAALQNRLIERLRSDGKLKPVSPNEAEMKEYFGHQKASLGKRPATLSFRQIVITPQPSTRARAVALTRADSILQALRKGADFATAAKRFSQDPGSKEQGGELNWFRRGTMVPQFERVAFSQKPGLVSDPVESPFGYHLIQVERIQPGEVQARHILIVPDLDSARVRSARMLSDSVHALLVKGAPFDSLQRRFHDQTAERGAVNVPADKLPAAYAKLLAQGDSGTVVPVFTLPNGGGRDQFVVLQITGRRPEGDVRYDDVRDRIRDQLGQQLAIRRYLDQLRHSSYIDLRT